MGVAGFTGIGGSFRMEWVAGFERNQWQAWTGIPIDIEIQLSLPLSYCLRDEIK